MSVARRTRPVTRLGSVSYDTYVRLRNAPENRSLSMAYRDGVLEILSPEFRHDHGFFNLSQSVVAYCRAFGVKCEAGGHTTFRKGLPGELKGKGREADASFYLGDSAALVRNKDRLDLSVDPPPSFVDRGRQLGQLGVPPAGLCKPRRHRGLALPGPPENALDGTSERFGRRLRYGDRERRPAGPHAVHGARHARRQRIPRPHGVGRVARRGVVPRASAGIDRGRGGAEVIIMVEDQE